MANNPSNTGKAQDSGIVDKAKQAASTVADKARDVASAVGQRAEGATEAVGSGMQSLAGTIRDKAPQGGLLGGAASGVASALDSSGRYLEEQGLSGMGEDLARLIRSNPFPAVFVGIAVGYLFARATRS